MGHITQWIMAVLGTTALSPSIVKLMEIRKLKGSLTHGVRDQAKAARPVVLDLESTPAKFLPEKGLEIA